MADQYAVIGNPVEHSLSPAIHAEFARATGQDIVYGKILAPLDGFSAAAFAFRDARGKGLNVTLPFKHEAWQLAGVRSGFALAASAVNTLTFHGSEIIGDNTDGIGLVRDLNQNLRVPVRGRRVLLHHNITPPEFFRGIDPELFALASEGDSAALARIEPQLIPKPEANPRADIQRPSMAQDILKGRRTEIDAMNGLIAAKGAEAGVPAPSHAKLAQIVTALERGELTASPALLGA